MTKKNIWYLHHYATPPTMSGLTRPYDIGKAFIRKGYNIKVFSSSYLHYSGEDLINDESSYLIHDNSGVPFVFLKTPAYNHSGVRRVWNLIIFYFGLLRISKISYLKEEKPDVIIASSPHPLTLLAGIKIAKKRGVPCICEIRDLWPESFTAYGLIGKNNPVMKLLYAGEKWIYKKADKLIFTMEGGRDYIIEKGWDTDSGGPIDLNKVFHINNGVDLEAFEYNRQHYQIEDEDLNDDNVFKVVYAGSIRRANKVGLLLDVAKILKEKGEENIKFLIWGDGDEKDSLENRAKEEKLANIYFKGRVEKKYIPYIISQSQLNVEVGEKLQLYDFGISANKTFEYFAAGKPILVTYESGYSLIEKNGAGIELSDSAPSSIADAILLYKNLPEDKYKSYSMNSREAAKDYDFIRLTEQLIQIVDT